MGSRRETLTSLQAAPGTNAGLWLEKGLADVEDKGPGRQALLEQVADLRVPAEYRRFFQRWRTALESQAPQTQVLEAAVQGRMAVGLGAESVLEISLRLHHTYGVPYIPGSALKGLAAAAAHKHLEDPAWRKTGEDGKIGPWHQILFGDQESSGYITFHDALWIPNGDQPPLDLDVMTVHHPDYYGGAAVPPADWDNPTPVAFLSARGKYLLAATGPEEWLQAALKILQDALQHDGIGAKTAAGYGRMKVDRPPEPGKPNWKEQLKSLNMGNADKYVPPILDGLKGEERRTAVAAFIEKLDRRKLRKSEREWARRLLEAAGQVPNPQ
jgi:CRISPR-associated protein Cmr6